MRLLRTSVVQQMYRSFNHAAHGLFERLRCRTHARRRGDSNYTPSRSAKRKSQRILLLRQRRTLRFGRSGRVVYVAFAISPFVHERVRDRTNCIWRLVRARLENTGR